MYWLALAQKVSVLISFGPEGNVSASLVHPFCKHSCTLMHQDHENITQQKPALSQSFNLNTNNGSRSLFKLTWWGPAARGQMKVGTKGLTMLLTINALHDAGFVPSAAEGLRSTTSHRHRSWEWKTILTLAAWSPALLKHIWCSYMVFWLLLLGTICWDGFVPDQMVACQFHWDMKYMPNKTRLVLLLLLWIQSTCWY